MNRLQKRFRFLKKQGGKAFIAFITAGYPSLSITEKLALRLAAIGVDVIELGVPFSDPMADGPAIQEASQVALKKGANLKKILKTVRNIRRKSNVPICLMTYYNPVFCFGEERFAEEASVSGVDGVIIPDLPPEEGKSFLRFASKYGLNVICFVSPTTSTCRIKYITDTAGGFIYYLSLTGVTGARSRLPAGLARDICRIKRFTSKPVCVGFGVSTRHQVRELSRAADGVIVGSAIINKIKENIGRKDLVGEVADFVLRLRG